MGQATSTTPKAGNVPNDDPSDVIIDVCSLDDIEEGQSKEVELCDTKALLVKSGGQFFCVGNKCSHFGAPLSKGVIGNGRVRCPWHGACFNLSTGDIEEFPGLDGIPCYQVQIKNNRVLVRCQEAKLSLTRQIKPMVTESVKYKELPFLIIGGGPASVTCAEALRQNSYRGPIIIATLDQAMPYDRTKLSKAMTTSAADVALRNSDFYEKYGINIQTNKEATDVDFANKMVTFSDNTTQRYNKLLFALGCSPLSLDISGSQLKNVFTLRSLANANTIAERSKGKDVVIVGSSFIALELAMYFSDKAKSVTVIARGSAPFKSSLGERVGLALMKLHESKGVKFLLNSNVTKIHGTDDYVSQVTLSDGSVLPCDVCIQAIGVKPATDFLRNKSLSLNNSGYITVDECMKTNIADVYAAGDCVEFPLGHSDIRVSIGHWQMALNHGRVAGINMSGQTARVHSVPYFWTVMYRKSVRFAGYNVGYDDIVMHGEPNDLKFAAFYTKNGTVVGVSSLNFDPVVSQIAEMLHNGVSMKKEDIPNELEDWLSKRPHP